MSEWIKTAKVGDRVVYLIAAWPLGWFALPGERYPVEGAIYTIREILIGPKTGRPHIRVAEIVNPPRPAGEIMFGAARFKPVAPQQKSIDALAALTDKPDPKLVEHIPVREAIEQ